LLVFNKVGDFGGREKLTLECFFDKHICVREARPTEYISRDFNRHPAKFARDKISTLLHANCVRGDGVGVSAKVYAWGAVSTLTLSN
jgi:hypothetical protein